MTKVLDLTGQKFGRLTVIKRVDNDKKGDSCWLCKCDCGNETVVKGYRLKNGHTRSCGCAKRKFDYSKPLYKSRIYRCYRDMLNRCINQNIVNYKNYGGRGIIVCQEWQDNFMNFYDWSMNNGYTDELTIDRIDNDKGYSPDNCRWATRKEQCNNFRKNTFITYKDETKTISEWASFLGVNYRSFYARLYRGWSLDRIFNQEYEKRTYN